MDKDWIPVVSGAVGAGGAVLAQVVAATFGGPRETRANKAHRAEARALAFVDQKRELFVRTLNALDQELEDYENFAAKAASGEISISIPTGSTTKGGGRVFRPRSICSLRTSLGTSTVASPSLGS